MKHKYLMVIIACVSVVCSSLQAAYDTYLFTSSKDPIDYQGFFQGWLPFEPDDETKRMVCDFQEECKSAYFVGFFYDQQKPKCVVSLENSAKIFSLDGESAAVVLHPEVIALQGDNEEIASRIDALAVVNHEDYPRIICGTQHGYIYRYSARTGELESIFQGVQYNKNDAFGITCFAMYEFQGEPYLVAGSCNGSVRIYNYSTGEEYRTFDAGSSVTSVAIFEDSSGVNVIAGVVGSSNRGSANQGEIICWDSVSGKERYRTTCFLDKNSSVQGLVLVKNKADEKNPLLIIPIIRDEYFRSYNACTGDLVNLFHDNVFQESTIADIKPFFDESSKEIRLVAGYLNGCIAVWSLSGQMLSTVKCYLPSEMRSLVLFEHANKAQGAFCTTSGGLAVFSTRTLQGINQAQVSGFLMEALASNTEISNPGLFFVSRDTQLTQGSRVPFFDLTNVRILRVNDNGH